MTAAERHRAKRIARAVAARWNARISVGSCGTCGATDAGGTRCWWCSAKRAVRERRNYMLHKVRSGVSP